MAVRVVEVRRGVEGTWEETKLAVSKVGAM